MKTNIINQKLIRDNKKIYYLRHKNESYLYFSECKKIVKIKETLNYWKFTEYKENILETIRDIINKNKDVNKYLNLKYKDIKQFY